MNVGGARVALVSEVLDYLLGEFGSETSKRSVLFQAALQVCAEESRRVKQGQPPASLEVLVGRARAVLGSPQGKAKLEAACTPKTTPAFDTSIETEPAQEPSAALFPRGSKPSAAIPEQAVQQPAELPPEPPPREPDEAGSVSDLFLQPQGFDEDAQLREPRQSHLPLLLGILGLVVVAGGTYMALQHFGPLLGLGGSPSSAPSPPLPRRAVVGQPSPGPAATPLPTAAPEPVRTMRPTAAPTPAPTAAPPRTPAAAPTPRANAARITLSDSGKPVPVPPAGWQTAETMVSADWAGRPPTYVIHFSSYRERSKAEHDAIEVSKRYGRPAYAAEVNVPGRGIWYRVIMGDFATAIAAHAFRADLVAARTPEIGVVYWVVAP
jgi:hypothetical protein